MPRQNISKYLTNWHREATEAAAKEAALWRYARMKDAGRPTSQRKMATWNGKVDEAFSKADNKSTLYLTKPQTISKCWRKGIVRLTHAACHEESLALEIAGRAEDKQAG